VFGKQKNLTHDLGIKEKKNRNKKQKAAKQSKPPTYPPFTSFFGLVLASATLLVLLKLVRACGGECFYKLTPISYHVINS